MNDDELDETPDPEPDEEQEVKDGSPELYEFEDEPDNIPEELIQAAFDSLNDDDSDSVVPDVEETVDYALEVEPGEHDFKFNSTISGMAEVLMRDNYFVTSGFSGELYVYIKSGKLGGTYIEASRSIELAIKTQATNWDIKEKWTSSNKRKEVYQWINKGLKTLEEPDLRHINVNNGLVYLAPNGEFMHFSEQWSADYLTTVKLPIDYDPNATCPAWEKFVSEVFPEDCQHIAWEIAALLMIPLKNKAASAIILKGAKNTGKTTFQNGIIAFLGQNNVSSLSIDKFGERFQDGQLMNKLANVVGEMPNIRLTAKAVNVIKQLIGNDMLSGEIKNGASFMFKSYARCLFSCNDMPTCDSDEAFFDRFNIIPFSRRQFSKDPLKEQEINAMLSSPEELSGLFNKALEVLPKVIREGIKPTASMKQELERVVEENDPLISWVKEYVEFGAGFQVVFSVLHEHYKNTEPNDYRRKSNKSFGRDLKKLFPSDVVKKQMYMDDGARPYGFNGVRLKEVGEPLDQTGFIEFDLEELTR